MKPDTCQGQCKSGQNCYAGQCVDFEIPASKTYVVNSEQELKDAVHKKESGNVLIKLNVDVKYTSDSGMSNAPDGQ